MKLTLLGTGNPLPNPLRAGPSQHIQAEDCSILIDCGTGVARRLAEVGLAVKDVEFIFLTHLHSDHCIDLGHVLIAGWTTFRSRPLRIVGPPGTKAHVEGLLKLWDWDLKVRRFPDRLPASVLDVQVEEIEQGSTVQGDGWVATAVRVDHYPVEQAFSFRFDSNGHSILISGDTAPCDAVVEAAKGVSLLLHEASQASAAEPGHKALSPEKAAVYFGWKSRYHTPAREAGRIAREAGAKQLVLTHIGPYVDVERMRREAEEGYGGPVIVGEDLMEF